MSQSFSSVREIDPFLDNLGRLAERVAAVLNGRVVLEDGLVGFVSSACDRFFNHLFATGVAALREVEAALAGRPGFVWLCDDAAAAGARTGGRSRPVRVVHGMRTTIRVSGLDQRTRASITVVSSFDDLADWHAVYRGVFGVDPRGLDDWRRVHLALGRTPSRRAIQFFSCVVVHRDKIPWPTRGPNVGQSLASAIRSGANRQTKSTCK